MGIVSSVTSRVLGPILGGKYSQVVPLPIPNILVRINECVLPEDREKILDLVEMIDINLSEDQTKAASAVQFKDSEGVLFLIRLMKKMIEDPLLIQVSIQVLEALKSNKELVMDFIQYGGLDVLEKVIRLHEKDEFIKLSVPVYMKYILEVGAKLSIKEMKAEGVYLQLCYKCSELIERSKRAKFAKSKFKIPRSQDRINKVFKLMENYIEREDVMVVGLDAALIFCRNPDAPSTTKDTLVINTTGKIIKQHIRNPEIMWRCCLILSLVSKFNGDLALTVGRLDVHLLLIQYFDSYAEHKGCQQQVLWFFAELLEWPKSRKGLHLEFKVMDFFKKKIEAFDEYIATSVANTTSDDLEPYAIVVPLSIRMFYRETDGEVLREDKKGGSKKKKDILEKKGPQRRNFGERPKFGVVDDVMGGKTGLT